MRSRYACETPDEFYEQFGDRNAEAREAAEDRRADEQFEERGLRLMERETEEDFDE